MPFYRAARRGGVKPLLGCRLAIRDARHAEACGTLVVLAEDLAGYHHLMRLSTAAQLRAGPGVAPGITIEELAAHRAGLVALSGGPEGPVNRAPTPDAMVRGALFFSRRCSAATRFLRNCRTRGCPARRT